MTIKRALLILCLVACCNLAARAQSPNSQTAAGSAEAAPSAAPATPASRPARQLPVRITRFEKPPVIDGNLDDEAWKQAATLDGFYQTFPGDNIAPSQPTTVRIGYDEKNLYLSIQAADEPGKVRATIAKRDNVLEDDYVSIYLDTFNDQRKAYVLTFNPLGVQQDGILTEGGAEDDSLDIVMESRGRVTENGYTVEVAIPFKSLRYVAGKDKQWGIHVFRRIKRLNDEQSSWMPILREKSGFLTQEGRLIGLEGIASERTVEIIPSLTLSETGKRVASLPQRVSPNDPLTPDPGRFVNKPLSLDPGLTAKLGISSKVTLDLALNPDFAQVEADETVVTANQRFPIFFAEKRPFFLEGIDIFSTPMTVLHTRAIVDPDVAAKLTGKSGRTTYGLLFASDNAPGNFSEEERDDPFLRPSIERFLDKNAYIGAVRLKRDVGKENSLGLIATTYNFVDRHNHVVGFDGRFRLDEQTTAQFQLVGTNTRGFFRDPDLGRNLFRTGNAFAYNFLLRRAGRNFGAELSGVGRTRDYRADVGFTRRTNTNNQQLALRYDSDPQPKAMLVSWHLFNQSVFNYDWQGRSQLFNIDNQVSFNFRRQSFVGAGYQKGYERLLEEEFGNKRQPGRSGAFVGADPERSTYRDVFYGYAGATPSNKFSFFFQANYTRGAFDFDFGGGPRFQRVSPAALLDPNAPLDPGAGNELSIISNFIYQPTEALRISLDYTKDRLTRHDTGRVAFDDNIYALRTTYQFSRFTFVRGRVDYDTLASNVRAQFLLGWTPTPGTSLYVGYNDDLNRNGFSPFTGQLEPGFRRNGRTFFLKMSYLFRRGF